jgi:hypothetical protein
LVQAGAFQLRKEKRKKMEKTFEVAEYKLTVNASQITDEVLALVMGNMPDDLDDKIVERIRLEQEQKFKDSLDFSFINMLESSMKIETKSYRFRDLSDEIQEKVLKDYRDFNTLKDWYIIVYYRTEEIGIKVKNFNLGRADYCEIEFIHYAEDTAKAILEIYGEETDIYKLAKQFLNDFNAINEDEEQELEDKFLDDLAEIIKEWLASELEYLESDEAIIESFTASECKFDKEGNML